PGVAQTPSAAPAASNAPGAAPIPDFSRVWTHPAFPWFEPLASGPAPVTNLSRWAVQQPADPLKGTQAQPPAKVGISDYDQLVGYYHNPILQPWAAEVVKKAGELALAGVETPNSSSQCWPFGMPFIYKQQTMEMIQRPDLVTIVYGGDFEVRRVRLNQPHAS